MRNLLLAALRPHVPAHELEIVNHDHANPMLALQAPRLGARFEHRDTRRVVDVDRRSGQAVDIVR